MIVVKLMAPCVVKKAMMKDMIEKKMEVEMLKDMLVRDIIFDKMKTEIIKGKPLHKPNMDMQRKIPKDIKNK